MKRFYVWLIFFVFLWEIILSHDVWAADTLETWKIGATDVGFFVVYDGIGGEAKKNIFSSNMLFGYGLLKNLSAYFQTFLQANNTFGFAQYNHNIGLLITPIDTRHVDMDFLFEIGVSDRLLSAKLMTELNLDLDPNQHSWGIYLKNGFKLYGYRENSTTIIRKRNINVKHELRFLIESLIGTYLTIKKNHQILLEVDFIVRPKPATNEKGLNFGGFSLGYNFKLNKTLELLNEIHLESPTEKIGWTFRISTGFIASL